MLKKLIISTLLLLLLFQKTFPSVENKSTPLQKTYTEQSKKSNNLLQKKSSPSKLNFFQKLALKILIKKLQKKAAQKSPIPVKKNDPLAIISLIAGLIAWFFALGFILSILAVILGAIAIYRIDLYPETRKGKGFAIAGLILGAAGIVIILFNLGFALAG